MHPQVLANVLRQIEAVIAELGEDAADTGLRSDMLEGSTDMDSVLSRLVRQRVRARADGMGAAEAKKVMAAHYDRRMAIAERAEDAMNDAIRTIMEAAALRSFRVPEGSISITPGRLSVVLADDFTPPQGLQRIKVEPDRVAIKAALEAGEIIPGAQLATGQPTVIVR